MNARQARAVYRKAPNSTPASRASRCYELATRELTIARRNRELFASWALIHGEIDSSIHGRIGHAWLVEPESETVWEPISQDFFDADEWAQFHPVEHVRLDGPKEASAALRAFGHYGPWHDVEEPASC